MTADMAEVAQKPPCQVDEVHTLIQEFAAPGYLRIGPPFAVVAWTSAVPIAAANEHHFAKDTALEDAAGLLHCAVVTMIESHSHSHFGSFGRFEDRVQFGCAAGAWFLDQDMFALGSSAGGDGGELVVGCGHDHDSNCRALYRGMPVRLHFSAGESRGQLRRTLAQRVAANLQAATSQRPGAFLSDEATTDNGNSRTVIHDSRLFPGPGERSCAEYRCP